MLLILHNAENMLRILQYKMYLKYIIDGHKEYIIGGQKELQKFFKIKYENINMYLFLFLFLIIKNQ